MAFKTPDLVSYYNNAMAQGQSEASIISGIFGLIAGGIAASKMKVPAPAPIAESPEIKDVLTPLPLPSLPATRVEQLKTPQLPIPYAPIPPTPIKPTSEDLLMKIIGAGCEANPITGKVT